MRKTLTVQVQEQELMKDQGSKRSVVRGWMGVVGMMMLASISAPLPGMAATASVVGELAGDLALGTAFRYQGRLQQHGSPAEGRFDLAFDLYDERRGGDHLGREERLDVELRGGSFVTELDFGFDVFARDALWVELQVRPIEASHFESLGVRQRLVGAGAGCTVDEDVLINGTLGVAAISTNPELTLRNGKLRLQGTSSSQLLLQPGEIAASGTIGQTSPLYLNADGGHVGIGTSQTSAPLTLPGGPDAEPGSGGALVIGDVTGANLAIDGNEIMARNNGAPSTLFLNANGGEVALGGPLDIGLVAHTQGASQTTVDVSCQVPGHHIVSGGCRAASSGSPDAILGSYPLNSTTWRCVFDGTKTENNQATVICGRLAW